MRAVFRVWRSAFVGACGLVCFLSLSVNAQQAAPVVVQPGAPGQPTKILPASTRALLPPRSPKDVEFMQGMIMHHAQAVEMTALIEERTENKELRLLGARISQSQSDEMNFMKRWLEVRGEPVSMVMRSEASTNEHSAHGKTSTTPTSLRSATPPIQEGSSRNAHHQMLMPGMLTPMQMDALRKAKGAEFDNLFLTGMIQHHNGALVMVKELFDTAGAGQDGELFSFTTDVDSGQRAEIRIMETMLRTNP
jgi:uncharacterized protein (DUF305 family)